MSDPTCDSSPEALSSTSSCGGELLFAGVLPLLLLLLVAREAVVALWLTDVAVSVLTLRLFEAGARFDGGFLMTAIFLPRLFGGPGGEGAAGSGIACLGSDDLRDARRPCSLVRD